MFRQAWRSAGVNVADKANLQGDALVENVLRQVAELYCFAVHDCDILDQPRSMSDAVCAAILNRLPDRFLPIAFSGVNRDIEVFPLNIVKRRHMFLRRITAFLSGEIKADHPARPK